MGQWDQGFKQLVRAAPQDFDSLVLPGAVLVKEVSTELLSRAIRMDTLHEVQFNGEPMLLHLEFQKKSDPEMGQRLLEYNMIGMLTYHLPVWSCVFYLVPVKTVETPWNCTLPGGQEVVSFHFRVIKLWELSVDDLLKTGHAGLYPLLPLTRDGRRTEVVERSITELVASNNSDLLAFTYLFSSLTFTNPGDLAWLKRRFAMLDDIFEDSWAYQEIIEKGRQKGLEEGREEGRHEGLQEGRHEGLIQVLLAIVEAHFPTLMPQATALVKRVHDPLRLQHLIVLLTLAQSTEEAYDTLRTWNNGPSAL